MRNYSNRTSFTTQKTDAADKWLLALAFVIGILGSLTLKALGVPVLVPAVYSGGVILVYALCAHYLPVVQLESDQIGDNAYYLGFVLTLTSLSFTLYELGKHGSDADFIADVIAGFGVALSSTIVGVVVRVIFLQFRLDLVARDREARLTLNDAMRQFRAELTDVIRGTKYLGVEIRQSLLESHEDLARLHSESSKNLYGDLIQSFRDALEPMKAELQVMSASVLTDAQSRIAASVESSKNLHGDLIKAFRDGLEPLQSELKMMSSSVLADAKSTVDASAEAREASFKATTAGLTKATDVINAEMKKLTEAVAKALADGATSLTTSTRRMSEQVSQTSRLLEEQRSTSNKVLAESAKLAAEMEALSRQAIEGLAFAAQKTAQALDGSVATALTHLTALRDAGQSLVQELQNQTNALAGLQLSVQQSEALSADMVKAALDQIREFSSKTTQSQQLQLSVLEKILDEHRRLAQPSTLPVAEPQ